MVMLTFLGALLFVMAAMQLGSHRQNRLAVGMILLSVAMLIADRVLDVLEARGVITVDAKK
jgi:hypothetical protein